MDAAELLAQTAYGELGDSLPSGTTCFYSTYHYPRTFWWVMISLFVAFPIFLMAASFASGTSSTVLFIVTLVILIVGLGTGAYLNLSHKAKYKKAVRTGQWLEGVFVFSDGTVDVRFTKVCGSLNLEVGAHALVKAKLEISFSWARCARVAHLVLTYFVAGGGQQTTRIPSDALVDDVVAIASSINDARLKAVHGADPDDLGGL